MAFCFFTVNGTAKAKSKTQDEPGMWPLVLWYAPHPKPTQTQPQNKLWPFVFTVNGTAKAKSKTQDEPGMWPLVLWYVHHTLNLPKPNHKINYGLFKKNGTAKSKTQDKPVTCICLLCCVLHSN